MADQNKPKEFLPSEVAQKYELVNWVGGHKQVFGKFGTIDLKELTVEKCAQLVKQEFSKIKAKSNSAVTKSKPASSTSTSGS